MPLGLLLIQPHRTDDVEADHHVWSDGVSCRRASAIFAEKATAMREVESESSTRSANGPKLSATSSLESKAIRRNPFALASVPKPVWTE